MADVMTGVPSIVMGLFIYIVWTLRFGFSALRRRAGAGLPDAADRDPLDRGDAASSCPTDLREASYALGARKSRTILTVVLPAALPGIVSGCLLAVARAAGETAPAAVHHRRVTATNRNLFSRAEHGAVGADLRQRQLAVRRRPGAGVGRGADAHR